MCQKCLTKACPKMRTSRSWSVCHLTPKKGNCPSKICQKCVKNVVRQKCVKNLRSRSRLCGASRIQIWKHRIKMCEKCNRNVRSKNASKICVPKELIICVQNASKMCSFKRVSAVDYPKIEAICRLCGPKTVCGASRSGFWKHRIVFWRRTTDKVLPFQDNPLR